jgi:16S rRNA processing protein RimM
LTVVSDQLLLVAQVGAPHGVRGEVRITTFTADPMALGRYKSLLGEDGTLALSLASIRPVKGAVVAKVKGAVSRNDAERLRGLKLYITRASLPPPEEDEFYLADLIGLRAEDQSGGLLGLVKTVHDFGAGDLLEIQPAKGASWWLPFTREAVPEVRLSEGRLVANPPIIVEGGPQEETIED